MNKASGKNKPIARSPEQIEEIKKAIEGLIALRKKNTLKMDWKKLRDEGRR